MKTIIAIILGLIGLVISAGLLYGAYGLQFNDPTYNAVLEATPEGAALVAWFRDLPLWRALLGWVWSGSLALGSLLLIFRVGLSAPLFWLSALVGAGLFATDWFVFGADALYDQTAIIFSFAYIIGAGVFALIAGVVKR